LRWKKLDLNGLFSWTTRLSQHQKGQTNLSFNEAQDAEHGSGISRIACTSASSASFAPRSRQITTPAPHHSIFTGQMLFLMPNEQQQSTECTTSTHLNTKQMNM